MSGSGYGTYEGAHDSLYGNPTDIPLVIASEESLKPFGRIAHNFDKEDVWLAQWPSNGRRPICPGTGRGGGIVQGLFKYKWKGDLLTAHNGAVQRSDQEYVVGRLPKGANPKNRTHVLVREANSHPDGGQVFVPQKQTPFVALLAPPGDDIKISDFRALYFDGSFGFQILPDVWHQLVYPLVDDAVFQGKQGAVHACKLFDSVLEFGKWMRVPLLPEFAQQE